MNKIGARIILLVLLLATCIPIGVYFAEGGANNIGNQTEIGELEVPDEDPIISDDEAMDIVLGMLPGADYGDIVDFSQSYDEDGWIYEGVVEGKKVAYKYQVDGDNGNLLSWVVVNK